MFDTAGSESERLQALLDEKAEELRRAYDNIDFLKVSTEEYAKQWSADYAALERKLKDVELARADAWKDGYAEGQSDGACIETCGNLLRHIVEHCDALFVKGTLDADRSELEMNLCGLLAGARREGPCERCTPGIEPIPDVHDVTKTQGYRAGVEASLETLHAEHARTGGTKAAPSIYRAIEAVAKLATWKTP